MRYRPPTIAPATSRLRRDDPGGHDTGLCGAVPPAGSAVTASGSAGGVVSSENRGPGIPRSVAEARGITISRADNADLAGSFAPRDGESYIPPGDVEPHRSASPTRGSPKRAKPPRGGVLPTGGVVRPVSGGTRQVGGPGPEPLRPTRCAKRPVRSVVRGLCYQPRHGAYGSRALPKGSLPEAGRESPRLARASTSFSVSLVGRLAGRARRAVRSGARCSGQRRAPLCGAGSGHPGVARFTRRVE